VTEPRYGRRQDRGLLAGLSRLAGELVAPSTPRAKIIVVFLVCFFPVVVSTASGMQAVPTSLLDLVRSLSANPLKVFLKIRLPNAMPYIFVGLKVAITLAVIGAVIGEFVGSNAGLGYLILVSTQQFDTALAFASIILLTVMSIVLFYAIEFLERLLIPWAPKQ